MKQKLLSEITYEGLYMLFRVDGIGSYTLQQIIQKLDGLNSEDIWNIQSLPIGHSMKLCSFEGRETVEVTIQRMPDKNPEPTDRPFACLDDSRSSWRDMVDELSGVVNGMFYCDLANVAYASIYLKNVLLPQLVEELDKELQ